LTGRFAGPHCPADLSHAVLPRVLGGDHPRLWIGWFRPGSTHRWRERLELEAPGAAAISDSGRLDRGAGGYVTSCPRCPVRPKTVKGGLLTWASHCSSGRPDRALSRLTLRFRRSAAGREEGPWKTLAGAGLAGDPGGSRDAPVMPAGCWLPSWRRVRPARIRRLPGPASPPGYREDGSCVSGAMSR
jgi:hypothetical protein